jgi:hypothetical protein
MKSEFGSRRLAAVRRPFFVSNAPPFERDDPAPACDPVADSGRKFFS